MIKIVTAIYSNLFNTDLGGRDSRQGHYLNSLKSLLKMTDAQFVCYTSQEELGVLQNFFYQENNFLESQITFKVSNLRDNKFHNRISQIKSTQTNVIKDRCYEIQYSKFDWCLNEIDDTTTNIFWFDAGLSHSGLIPPRLLDQTRGYWEKYFESKLFNNNLLNNLLKTSENKIALCAKENRRNYWSKTLPQKYYNKYCFDHHIIGGFFGGKKELVMEYCKMVLKQIDEVLENENTLYLEENIMSLVYYNHQDLFTPLFFDIWWHEDDNIPGVDLKELTKTEKSFYKILEELNGIEFQNQLKVETQNKINKIFNN